MPNNKSPPRRNNAVEKKIRCSFGIVDLQPSVANTLAWNYSSMRTHSIVITDTVEMNGIIQVKH
eukprot:scaffold401545_cov18-Prasinocladus_malaysianus.AAC.2